MKLKKSTIHADINVELFHKRITELETQCKQNKLQETKIKEKLEKVNKIKTTQEKISTITEVKKMIKDASTLTKPYDNEITEDKLNYLIDEKLSNFVTIQEKKWKKRET